MRKFLAALTIMGFLFLTVGAYAQQPPAKPEKPAKPEPGPRAPLANMKDFLKLTPEQEAKIKDMQKARQDEQKAFRDQMQKLRGELNPLLKDPKADQNKINSLVDQIAKLGADRTKKVLANRNPLQKILTPEQLEKLKNAPARMMGGRGMGPGMQGMGQGMGRMGEGRFMRPGMGQGMGPGMHQGMRPGLGMGRGMGMGFMGPRGFRGRGMHGRPWGKAIMKHLGKWFGKR
jgi:Spy/CpxP family protein refolding chaperone